MAEQVSWGKIGGGVATLVGVIASVVGIWQYIQATPRYDISGAWTIENTVEKTSYEPYQGMRETFKVTFTQNGNTFTGVGEKWSDNGKELNGAAHTPLTISGTVDGSGHIQAAFTCRGAKRETSGGFNWQANADRKRWTGSFESTAADSSGPSVLTR
jgi:hypothetical protein